MNKLDEEKRARLETMFFTLKIMTLFFSSSPIFLHYFSDNASAVFVTLDLRVMMIFLVVILVITLMWLLVTHKFKKIRFGSYFEMAVLYVLGVTAIAFSNTYQSYYKFIFVFMIIIYTMEMSAKVGYALATLSSVTICAFDLVLYKVDGVNPYFQTDIILSAMFFVIVWILGFYIRLENEHIQNLKDSANIDGLTHTYNHRYMYDILTSLFENDPQCSNALSFVMTDIDYFKSYNDMYGHQKGDEVLVEIANILKKAVGKNGVVVRYGGEEFSVIYEGIEKDEALVRADKIRTAISSHVFEGQEFMPNKNLTVSIGVTERMGEADTVKDMINRADSALYRAKYLRKNRVELYSSVFDKFPHINVRNDESMLSVKSLITIINSRDRYTYDHTERVVYFCEIYADYVHMKDAEKRTLLYSAYLHDIGKINISKETLIADRKLTESEWNEVKRHPGDGAEILRQLNDMNEIADIVEQHHERFDGKGYPKGLAGENIHMLARILAIADSFDAMTAKRVYQLTKTDREAFAEIRRCAGTQFDPQFTELFIQAIIKNTNNY